MLIYAAMAELVDALDSGSSRGNSVDVRVILAAIFLQYLFRKFFFANMTSNLALDRYIEGLREHVPSPFKMEFYGSI